MLSQILFSVVQILLIMFVVVVMRFYFSKLVSRYMQFAWLSYSNVNITANVIVVESVVINTLLDHGHEVYFVILTTFVTSVLIRMLVSFFVRS